MLKKYLPIFCVVFVLGISLLPSLVSAELTSNSGPYLGLEYGKATGLSGQDVRLSVANIINTVLGVLGTIAVVIVIFAGFKWMTSGGNEESVKGAQKMLAAAVIGLVIILSAYAITRFVMTQLYSATTGQSYTGAHDNF